jgi:hypothetical protein
MPDQKPQRATSTFGKVLIWVGCIWFAFALTPLGISPLNILITNLDPNMHFTIRHHDFYRYTLRAEFPVAAALVAIGVLIVRRSRGPLSLVYSLAVIVCAAAMVFLVGGIHGWFHHRRF